MPDAASQPLRRSPVHRRLDALGAHWTTPADMPAALHFGDPAPEAEAARTLALCDASLLPKFGVKGLGARQWLADQGIGPIDAIYASAPLPGGGLCVRIGNAEYLFEGDVQGQAIAELEDKLGDGQDGVSPIRRQDSTFLLMGSRRDEVLAQTCGLNPADLPDQRTAFTRVAGVSCALRNEAAGPRPTYRLWIDYGSADYLWHTLAEIIEELGGRPVGIAAAGLG